MAKRYVFLRFIASLAFLAFLGISLLGCPPAPKAIIPPTDSTSASEVAEALISGAVQASTSGGTGTQASHKPALFPNKPLSVMTEIKNNLTFVQPAFGQRVGVSVCPTLNAPGITCVISGNVMDVPLPVCYFPSQPATVSWSGTEVFTKTGGPTALSCTAMPTFASGDTLVRTFSNPTTRMTTNSVIVLLDTSGAISGSNPAVATTGFLTTYGTPPAYTIQITGIHLAASLISYIVWDYVATSNSISVDAGGAADAGGVVTMQDLVKNRIATASITSNLTFTAGCCMATGGTIHTVFVDANGATEPTSETLTMTGSCGGATLNGTPITLTHCW